MNLMIVVFKTLFIYVLVAMIFRVMGKREVGQLGTFDLVVFILIAELVALALEHKDGFLINLVPVIILVLLQIIIAKVSLKSVKFRNFVDGKPVIIIKKGIVNFKNMVEQRYTLDDLLLQLREKDVRSLDEVDYAILETNGKLSVFKKDDKDKKTYPLPIILDGKEVNFSGPKDALENGVAMVHQELNQCLERSVVDNLFLGRYPKNSLGVIDEGRMKKEASDLFRKLGITVNLTQPMKRMSVSKRQMCEIAKAISYNSKVIVLDTLRYSIRPEGRC